MISVALPRPFRQRFERWFDRRNPPSAEAILLHNRRLYILPTRFGYLFGFMLISLFLAAINYQNSMAFVLTFMLTSLGIVSLWQTHKNLLGVRVRMQIPRPVFCGEECRFEFELSHEHNARRYAIGIQYQGQPPVYVSLGPGGSTTARLALPTHRRGEFRPAGITLFTRYPTGLFHAWGWLRFEVPVLVYPRPITEVRLLHTLVEQYDGETATSTIEGDDFAGLREHREGESLRHISWKAYAQGKGLLTKTFQGQARPSLWIDWSMFDRGSIDERISAMTGLVLAAEREQQKYGLKLPTITIEQSLGNAHKHLCLQELAIFRQADTRAEFDVANG